MNIDLIAVSSLASIWLLILVMRTNVSLAIMGLCAGYVFSDLLSDELVSLVVKNTSGLQVVPIVSFVSITLILVPALLILFRFRTHQSGRFLQHLIPAFGFALLAMLLIYANLPLEAVRYLRDTSVLFQQLEQLEILIAAAVVGIAVVDVIVHDGEHKRRYKRRHK